MHFPRFKGKTTTFENNNIPSFYRHQTATSLWHPRSLLSSFTWWCWSLSNDPVCLLSCGTKLQVSARGLEGKAAPEQSFKLVTYYCCHPFHYSPHCASTASLAWSSHVSLSCARSLLPMQMNVKHWFLVCSHFKSRFLQLWGTAHSAAACKSRAMCWGRSHLELISSLVAVKSEQSHWLHRSW